MIGMKNNKLNWTPIYHTLWWEYLMHKSHKLQQIISNSLWMGIQFNLSNDSNESECRVPNTLIAFSHCDWHNIYNEIWENGNEKYKPIAKCVPTQFFDLLIFHNSLCPIRLKSKMSLLYRSNIVLSLHKFPNAPKLTEFNTQSEFEIKITNNQ